MIDLIETSSKLCPKAPAEAFVLNPSDRKKYLFISKIRNFSLAEWDDDMTYPVIQHHKFTFQAVGYGLNLVII